MRRYEGVGGGQMYGKKRYVTLEWPLTGAMCKTSQCELRSLRVNSGMLNVIRIVTYYTLPPLESPDSFWIAMAISR